jgi:D-sedoheptulose 7-phosphate isomerase
MNKVTELFVGTKTPSDFARGYLTYLGNLFNDLSEKEIGKFIEIVLEARETGKKLFFMGNGGSAATADHFVNDISIGTRTTGKPFKAYSLSSNVAVITALGNDNGYEDIFVKQLEALMSPGDVVIAISASGNSPNVVKAIKYANEKGATTIGLTGFDGGKLHEISQYKVHVPTSKGEYGPVEDIHMIFDHILGNYLLNYCKKND